MIVEKNGKGKTKFYSHILCNSTNQSTHVHFQNTLYIGVKILCSPGSPEIRQTRTNLKVVITQKLQMDWYAFYFDTISRFIKIKIVSSLIPVLFTKHFFTKHQTFPCYFRIYKNCQPFRFLLNIQ